MIIVSLHSSFTLYLLLIAKLKFKKLQDKSENIAFLTSDKFQFVKSLLYIIMDLSFLGEPSKQLVCRSEESKQNISNCNLKESHHQVGDKSCASLLLESLRSKESQRLKIKMEREANIREDLMAELKEKCQQLKKELEKSRNNVKCLSEENKQLKKMMQTLRRGIEEKKLAVQKQQNRLNQSNKHKEEEMKQSLLTLSQEKEKLRSSLSLLTKQNQITIKRLQFQLEETKSELNSKVIIKEKQLLKIQDLFQKRKKQFQVSLNSKEQEIQHLEQINSDLTFQICALRSELNKSYEDVSLLESKTNELENLYKNEFMKFQCEVEKMREDNDQEILSHKQLLNSIQNSLKDFDLQFQIQPKQYDNIFQHISFIKEKLKQKYKNSKESDEIAKARSQIQSLRNTELQLRSKVNIIQQELDFTKKNITKNQNIADIVKQHLNNHQKKMKHYDKENQIFKKQIEIQKVGGSLKKNQDNQQIQSLIGQAKQCNSSDLGRKKRRPLNDFINGARSNRFNDEKASKTHSRSQSKTIINKYREETCIIPCFSQQIQQKLAVSPKNETANNDREFNNLKAELTTKKKSLIYMMYKGEGKRPEEMKPAKQRSSRHSNAIAHKQRSCSMGELVRRRCLEHLQ